MHTTNYVRYSYHNCPLGRLCLLITAFKQERIYNVVNMSWLGSLFHNDHRIQLHFATNIECWGIILMQPILCFKTHKESYWIYIDRQNLIYTSVLMSYMYTVGLVKDCVRFDFVPTMSAKCYLYLVEFKIYFIKRNFSDLWIFVQ